MVGFAKSIIPKNNEGRARCYALREELAIADHCLLDAITEDTHFSDWIARVGNLPDYLIDSACGRGKVDAVGKTRQASTGCGHCCSGDSYFAARSRCWVAHAASDSGLAARTHALLRCSLVRMWT